MIFKCVAGRRKVQQFPVKLTEPLTAILYITADKFHMEDLKHVLHLQSVNEGRYNCYSDTLK